MATTLKPSPSWFLGVRAAAFSYWLTLSTGADVGAGWFRPD